MISHGWKFEDSYPITISVLQLMRLQPVSSKRAIAERNKWEDMWMSRLYTYVPQGLNVQD
jgi:hypothetical protein